MTIKNKLAPFFAAGVLVSSVAARAQTANNPDTSSSATGQTQGSQSGSYGGSSAGATGDAGASS